MRDLFRPTQLDRYVFRQLGLGIIAITSALVALIWLTQSLRFIQLIADRGLSPLVFVRLTLLLVPSFIAVILPITCFIVILFVYSRLAGDRELTVMRASGVSDAALTRPALTLAASVMLVCYGLNIWLVPTSLGAFKRFEFDIRNRIAAFLLEPGVFTPISEHVTVYVQSRSAGNRLHGIMIEDSRQSDQPATILARSGQLISSNDGPEVLLEDGSREQVDPKTGQLDVLLFKSNLINLAQSTKMAALESEDASDASMHQLLNPPATIPKSAYIRWLAEANRRLADPFATFSYALIALYTVLGGAFARHGAFVRPLIAVAVVTSLLALSLGVDNLAAKHAAMIPLIWLMAFGPGLVTLYVMFGRRVGRRAVPVLGQPA
ncbi:MAG: LPS export ABC transporter permease LptF [Rhodospirillales bacterium 20-60-12]|nr:MAG: LPS export ABC transporter permease LptF [Rhodospirillales bacterium 20-60-12]HQT66461.1 LPS export ABC transporter permease LptF [Acetobacteraceae bacterium]